MVDEAEDVVAEDEMLAMGVEANMCQAMVGAIRTLMVRLATNLGMVINWVSMKMTLPSS